MSLHFRSCPGLRNIKGRPYAACHRSLHLTFVLAILFSVSSLKAKMNNNPHTLWKLLEYDLENLQIQIWDDSSYSYACMKFHKAFYAYSHQGPEKWADQEPREIAFAEVVTGIFKKYIKEWNTRVIIINIIQARYKLLKYHIIFIFLILRINDAEVWPNASQ